MNPDQWKQSADPTAMLMFLSRRFPHHDRKFRLFAVLCCKRFANLLKYKSSRTAVEISERVQGLATWVELRRAANNAYGARTLPPSKPACSTPWTALPPWRTSSLGRPRPQPE